MSSGCAVVVTEELPNALRNEGNPHGGPDLVGRSTTSSLPAAPLHANFKLVLRILSHALLSVLMVLTLIWGGCISCPQFFMFPGTQVTAKKNCCSKTGQCPRKPAQNTPAKECERIALELQSFAHLLLDLPPAIQPLYALPDVETPTSFFTQPVLAPAHSPPDLNILHATFLI